MQPNQIIKSRILSCYSNNDLIKSEHTYHKYLRKEGDKYIYSEPSGSFHHLYDFEEEKEGGKNISEENSKKDLINIKNDISLQEQNRNKMTNFKNAIAEAKEWKLDAYVKDNQLIVKKKGGTQVVARIEADGKISYQASGYSTSITDIAKKVTEEKGNTTDVNTSIANTGRVKMSYGEVYNKYGFDAAEEGKTYYK